MPETYVFNINHDVLTVTDHNLHGKLTRAIREACDHLGVSYNPDALQSWGLYLGKDGNVGLVAQFPHNPAQVYE